MKIVLGRSGDEGAIGNVKIALLSCCIISPHYICKGLNYIECFIYPLHDLNALHEMDHCDIMALSGVKTCCLILYDTES